MRFDVSSIPGCITLQRFRQILKELILNLHYNDEDQKSETIVYSYQAMEKKKKKKFDLKRKILNKYIYIYKYEKFYDVYVI